MPPDELNKNLIDQQLKANAEAFKGSSLADLANKKSNVYKMPEIPKEVVEIPEKPKFDAEGFPVIDTLRTYQGDLADAVENNSMTATSMALAEQKRRQAQGINTPSDTKGSMMKILIITLVSLFFLSGIGVLIFSFIKKNNNVSQVVTQKVEKDIIASEEKIPINLDHLSRAQIISSINNLVADRPEERGVRNIIPKTKDVDVEVNISLQNFFDLLGTRIPSDLSRSLYDRYFLGINFDGGGEPFMIMFTTSYDTAYPGLLKWEDTLQDDIGGIFAKEASSTIIYKFVDRIILNKDTRSLEDSNKNILFFYTFLDPNTIAIAKSADTLKVIIERLRVSRLQ